MNEKNKLIMLGNENNLFERISEMIEKSRLHVAKAVNTAMVYTYHGVGRYIVEYEQSGNFRASYGRVLNRHRQIWQGLVL